MNTGTHSVVAENLIGIAEEALTIALNSVMGKQASEAKCAGLMAQLESLGSEMRKAASKVPAMEKFSSAALAAGLLDNSDIDSFETSLRSGDFVKAASLMGKEAKTTVAGIEVLDLGGGELVDASSGFFRSNVKSASTKINPELSKDDRAWAESLRDFEEQTT